MTMYAGITNGVVLQIMATAGPAPGWNPSPLTWVDIDALSPQPAQGWSAAQKGSTWTFTAPSAPSLTLAQQAVIALSAGVTISLSGTMTLAATAFPIDANTQQKIGAVVTTLLATGAFPGGATTYPMKDAAGSWHTFTETQYKTVAGAIAAYVASLTLIVDGNPTNAADLPSSTISLTV